MFSDEKTKTPPERGFLSSGRRDSNSGPLVPQTSALTRLRHAPRPPHPSGHPETVELEHGWRGRERGRMLTVC